MYWVWNASGPCRKRVRLKPDEGPSVPHSIFLLVQKGYFAQAIWPLPETKTITSLSFSSFLYTAPSANKSTRARWKNVFRQDAPAWTWSMQNNRKVEWAQRATAEAPNLVCDQSPSCNPIIFQRWMRQRSEPHTCHSCLTKAHQPVYSSRQWFEDCYWSHQQGEYSSSQTVQKTALRMASSVGTAEPSVELIPTTPRKSKPGRCTNVYLFIRAKWVALMMRSVMLCPPVVPQRIYMRMAFC